MTGGEGGNLSISWNYDNKPATIQRGGTTISLLYDYTGHRVKKTVGSTSTVYIDKLYECTGTACKKHVFAGPRRIATKTASDTLYYHPDHLGSSAIVTNNTGTKAKEIYYYPYGETRTESGTADIKHKYTGQELDNETGIYNYKARYYHPVLARFISPDTVVQNPTDSQPFNRYSYAWNNPINYVDPSGRTAFWWHAWYATGAELAAGQGFLSSIAMGIKSLWVDFNNFSGFRPDARYTVEHGMGGSYMRDDGRIGYQDPGQAISGGITGFWNAIDKGNLGKAYHFVQDMATEDHPGKNWARLSGADKANHIWGDIFLSSDERTNMAAWGGIGTLLTY